MKWSKKEILRIGIAIIVVISASWVTSWLMQRAAHELVEHQLTNDSLFNRVYAEVNLNGEIREALGGPIENGNVLKYEKGPDSARIEMEVMGVNRSGTIVVIAYWKDNRWFTSDYRLEFADQERPIQLGRIIEPPY